MRTIAETFLTLNAAGTLRPDRAGRRAAPDPLAICDATRDAYLAQPDLPATDAELAPLLFDGLRALLVPSSDLVPAVVEPDVVSPAATPAGLPLLLAAAPILAGVLIASITLGTVTLSIVLALAMALLVWLGGGGSLFGFALPVRTAPAPARRETPRAVTRLPDLARLETAFRQADALLARVRAERSPPPLLTLDSSVDQSHLQFLQDLAEAGAADDGGHLVKLVSRRLPSIAQGQNLRLARFEDAPEYFVIDEAPDADRRGATTTLRPAILRGERCLARGYARRYV